MTSTSPLLTDSTPAVSSAAPPMESSELADQLLERARSIGPMLREHSEVAERERRLPKAVLDTLAEAGFQRMLVPRSLGGLEVDPLTCARVVEEVRATTARPARGAITELKELALRNVAMGSTKTLRDRGGVQATLAKAEGILRSGRALFYDTLSEAWARTLAGGSHTMEQRADLLLAGIHAAESAVQATTLMHGLAGTTGIYTRSRLDRYFRDVHTLHHHGFVSESKLESVGQIYLGLPPDFPLIAL